MITKLRYGNTNTYFIRGTSGGLLVDTDYAGTLPGFFRALKNAGLSLKDLDYVMATHYHPDHCGLIGKLQELGVKLVVWDVQTESTGYPDYIFEREKADYKPADLSAAAIVPCSESRRFLESLGIRGEVIPLSSHSPDSVAVLLDSGECLAGDLEPMEYLSAYGSNPTLRKDWDAVLSHGPGKILFSHANEKNL